jgi:ATP-dependent Lhr-like helicase
VIGRLHRGTKRLVFCDSRAGKDCDWLRARGVRTFVSHSSLSASERKHAENAFSQDPDCVIVATSTLELGIDVGDLDYVIQIDAPSTVSSFLQRMGRSGRRSGLQRNYLFLATTDESFLVACGLVRLWKEGYIEPVVPPPEPWHLVAQQAMALVLQTKGVGEGRPWPGSNLLCWRRKMVKMLWSNIQTMQSAICAKPPPCRRPTLPRSRSCRAFCN